MTWNQPTIGETFLAGGCGCVCVAVGMLLALIAAVVLCSL